MELHAVLLIAWSSLLITTLRLCSADSVLKERPSCNLTLPTLSSLRDYLTPSDEAERAAIICVDLRPVDEFIDYSSEAISAAGIVITGSANGSSVVRCRATTPELSLDNYKTFPMVFTNTSLVVVERVRFEDCQRPLHFIGVTRVEFISSNFRNFSPGGVLDISNCPQVIVSNCTFTNNTSLGIGMNRYSGNAGAVSIGYDDTPRPDHHRNTLPFIRIVNSVFRDNNSTAMEGFQYDAAQVLSRRIYNQRGGGVACYFGASNYSADVEIKGCTFERNYVRDSGGGVYMFLTGEDNGHSVKVRETNVISNTASVGGGLEFSFDTFLSNLSNPPILNHVLIEDSTFTKNVGRYGGGYSHIQINTRVNLNNLTFVNCTFVENTAPVGSALYLQYVFAVNHEFLKKMIFVQDCTFLHNTAQHGVLFASRNTVGIQGNTTFIGSVGPAIQSFGSLITFAGNILFANNSNHPEGFSGVLHLAAFGQVLLQRGVNVTFTNNTGALGGAIAITGQLVLTGSSKQLYNPQCFLQYENSTTPPPLWEVNMVFENNQANVGPIIYASNLRVCTWFNVSSPFFNSVPQDVWSFIESRDNYLLRGNAKVLKKDHYFQTSVTKFSLAQNQERFVMAYPGESISLDVIASDEFDHETTAFLEIKDEAAASPVTFEPSIVHLVAGSGQITFTYLSNETDLLLNTTAQLSPSFTIEEIPGAKFTLVHILCLPGYSLRGGRCVCEETSTVAFCVPDKTGIFLVSGLWGAPPSWSRELVTYTCPPGYCDCRQSFDGDNSVGCLLNYTEPDRICIDTRNGLLCGQCDEGYGVGLLTNECKQFPDRVPQFWLFPIYFGILVPLLVAIVRLGVHLPTLLRGFIFYVQISPIAVEYLPQTFRLRLDIMSCLASILALYMPYDFNFHEGMTSLESYGLRYITPLVALIVVPIASKVRRPRSKHLFTGIWTVIQLLYTMMVNTSSSLLLCARLNRSASLSTSSASVKLWFYDGSIECYHGWHILLSIVAILSLLFLGILVVIVITALHFNVLHRKVHPSFSKLEDFSTALTKGLKKSYYWWPVVELAARYFFVVVVVFSVGQQTIPLFLMVLFFMVQFYLHPYEDTAANYLESFSLFILVVVLGLGNTTVFTDAVSSSKHFTLAPVFYLPAVVGGVVTVVFVGYQIWTFYKHRRRSRKLKKSKLTRNVSMHRQKITMEVTRTELSFDDESDSIDDGESLVVTNNADCNPMHNKTLLIN